MNSKQLNQMPFQVVFRELTFQSPSSITLIGDYAFAGCQSLTHVTIPSSIGYLGRCAFACCESLVEVIIPKQISTFFNHSFDIGTNLMQKDVL